METKKQYFFVISDEGHNFFETSEMLIKFLTDNTSEDETVEVGSEELTKTEWAALSKHGDDFGPYKTDMKATATIID